MQRLALMLLVVATLGAGNPAAPGEQIDVPPEHHAWARFEPGAWCLVRIVIENLEDGVVSSTSTTEQRTTLVKVNSDSVTLRVEAVVEVAGKKLDAPPQTVRQLFLGETLGPMANFSLSSAGAGTVTIEGKARPCEVLNLEIHEPAGKTTVKTYYSRDLAPYVLRSESKTTTSDDEKDQPVHHQTQVEVVALEMPHNVLGQLKSTAVIHEVTTKAKGTERVLLRRAADVPGGIVSRSAKELDSEGRLIRRSTLELIDFGTEP